MCERACSCVRACYLQVCELPGLVVGLGAGPGEGLPEVHLDQLPVGAVADVSEHAGNTEATPSAGRQVALRQPSWSGDLSPGQSWKHFQSVAASATSGIVAPG